MELHLVAFIGWLAVSREVERQKIGTSSIKQYLSAIRQMKMLVTGMVVPPYPFLSHRLANKMTMIKISRSRYNIHR